MVYRWLLVFFFLSPLTACDDEALPEPPAGPTGWVPGSGYRGIPPVGSVATPPVEEKVLGIGLCTDPTDDHPDPLPRIVDEDIVGDLAIAALWAPSEYYTDGRHNDNAWTVGVSTTVGLKGAYPAYTISPPAQLGTSNLRSRHGVFYRFRSAGPWRVWDLRAGDFTVLGEVAAEDVAVGGWTHLDFIKPNHIGFPKTIVFTPADAEIAAFHTLGEGVTGAVVRETPFGDLVELRYALPGTPFDTVMDYGHGPGSWRNLYGLNRQTYPVKRGEDPGIVWQDHLTGQPWVTWLSNTDPGVMTSAALPKVASSTEPLPEPLCTDTCEGGSPGWAGDGECDDGGAGSSHGGCAYGTDCTDCGARSAVESAEVLAAAASDPDGNLYVLHIEAGNGKPNDVREAWLIKSDPEGNELHRAEVDTSREGLNMTIFGSHQDADNHGTLKWASGRLGLMLTRTMTQAGDGLNHQGGIAAVFDDDTLERVAFHGQTSGHSFSNFLTVDSGDQFLGIDLGDNYPRGVNLHRFTDTAIASRVVYTFKTAHGTSGTNPAGNEYPPYPEISAGDRSFFQWSNDNATYTEIGGVAETPDGLAVFFATERSELDNGRATQTLNDPRDVAMVVVRKDFEQASRGDGGNVITDDLVVSSGGAPTEGGFYGFNGGWHNQRNAGVIWLTDYPDTSQNASRLKVYPEGDTLFLLWERWSGDTYDETFAMRVSPEGETLVPATALDGLVRLGFREDLFGLGPGVASVAGRREQQRFVLHLFRPHPPAADAP